METLTFDEFNARKWQCIIDTEAVEKQRKYDELVANAMPFVQPILDKIKVEFMQEFAKPNLEGDGIKTRVQVNNIDASILENVENGPAILCTKVRYMMEVKGFKCYCGFQSLPLEKRTKDNDCDLKTFQVTVSIA